MNSHRHYNQMIYYLFIFWFWLAKSSLVFRWWWIDGPDIAIPINACSEKEKIVLDACFDFVLHQMHEHFNHNKKLAWFNSDHRSRPIWNKFCWIAHGEIGKLTPSNWNSCSKSRLWTIKKCCLDCKLLWILQCWLRYQQLEIEWFKLGWEFREFSFWSPSQRRFTVYILK